MNGTTVRDRGKWYGEKNTAGRELEFEFALNFTVDPRGKILRSESNYIDWTRTKSYRGREKNRPTAREFVEGHATNDTVVVEGYRVSNSGLIHEADYTIKFKQIDGRTQIVGTSMNKATFPNRARDGVLAD